MKLRSTILDYVLCDPVLKAEMVITLEDSVSHVTRGVKRDARIDTVLNSCGVSVLHIASIEPDLRTWIEEYMYYTGQR